MPQAKIPPGPKDRFLIGHSLQYARDPLGCLTRAARAYGDVVRLRIGGADYYLLSHPEHVEFVLSTRHENFVKDKLTLRLTPLLSSVLPTSEGDYWRQRRDFWRMQRRLALPAFQFQQLHCHGAVMVERAERMLRDWHDGQERDIAEEMMGLTIGILAQVLFGADLAGEAREVSQALHILNDRLLNPLKSSQLLRALPLPSTLRYRRAMRRLDEILYRIIRHRREGQHDPGDLFSRLMDARDDSGGGMTDQQLRDEAVALLVAGHETTAMALTYAFYLLAQHPNAEERLASELEAVLGDRMPTAADVPQLRHTEGVVRESLRLYSPAWSIGREALSDCEIGGYHVPRGTKLLLAPWVVHRDPRWYEDPEAFRPERWADGLIKRLPRCAYFPFGHGPRVCIAQHLAHLEAVLILASVAHRFRLSLAPEQALVLFPSLTLQPRHGLPMVIHSRRGAPRCA